MKNTNQQGETKSAPPEISKLPRKRCALCGMVSVAAMMDDGKCRNAIACSKRQRRAQEKPNG
jgi:hypothetical protein